MDEIRSAMDRIGNRHSPGAKGTQDVRRRAESRRRRERAAAGVAGTAIATVAVVAGVYAFLPSKGESGSRGAVPIAAGSPSEDPTGPPPDCSWPEGQPFEATLSADAGTPGTQVTVTGPMPLFDQAGRYEPTTDIEVWWNVDPATWEYLTPGSQIEPSPGVPGDIEMLGMSSVDECSFAIDVVVPDVDAGTYPIVLIGVDPEQESATIYGSMDFSVT